MSAKALIIPAAGSGRRMQRDLPKPFIKLAGQPILAHTIRRFLNLQGLTEIVVATSDKFINQTQQILREIVGPKVAWQCIEGGKERQHSVHEALKKVTGVDLVLVHDAVRPFVTLREIEACCDEAEKSGAAILGIPSKDTIKEIDGKNFVKNTPDRKLMWQVQTPQVFQTVLLKRAYEEAAQKKYLGTDDASLVEWLDEPVKVVRGSVKNIKLTYPQDLELARILLKDLS